MVLIKKKYLLLIILYLFFVSCSAQDQKMSKGHEQTNDQGISNGHEQTTCCIKMVKEIVDYEIVEFEKDKFKFISHDGSDHSLFINNKEYLLNISLVSADAFFHFYKYKDKTFIFLQGDDYYSSIFDVLLYNDINLYYLGDFYIEEPEVEDIGKYKIDFDIQVDDKNVNIHILLNGKLGERIEFSNRKLIKKKQ